MTDRAGVYRNNLSGDSAYRSFIPHALPPSPPVDLDEETVRLSAEAHRRIGILETMSSQLADIGLFVAMYVRKEALLSSQIEGTQATLDDILDPDVEKSINLHVIDVINYIRATRFAMDRMKELPLCNRLLQETHNILMQGVRGGDKNPGEFRRSQNWIGPAGSTIKNARYIPPNPTDMDQAMSDLEKFIHADDSMDLLIKIALIHYQFETIHPFLDGNGRIGRLLITLFLIEKQLLSHETLYISYFFKRNRIEYYDRLNEVRLKGDFEQWVRFFLEAISASAQDAISNIDALNLLHERNRQAIETSIMGKAKKTSLLLFGYLERSPIIDVVKTAAELGLSYNAVSNAIKSLTRLQILKQTTTAKRNRVFAYDEYLDILRKDTELLF